MADKELLRSQMRQFLDQEIMVNETIVMMRLTGWLVELVTVGGKLRFNVTPPISLCELFSEEPQAEGKRR